MITIREYRNEDLESVRDVCHKTAHTKTYQKHKDLVTTMYLDYYAIEEASLGRLLKMRGLKVASQKLDPYINVDPGTMSPYQHGEVFVTEDGAETDLDLGHYERFIDEDLNRYIYLFDLFLISSIELSNVHFRLPKMLLHIYIF